MTDAIETLRRVRARWVDDIGWPNDPDYDLPLHAASKDALDRLEALVRAADALIGGTHHADCTPPDSDPDAPWVGCEYQPLAAALRAVKGEQT